MAVEAFELLRHGEQLRDERIAVALLAEFRLRLDGFGERHRIGRVVRHELAEPVDLAIGHLQHTADVAQHRARLQLAESDDLGDAIGTVLLLHVANDLVTPLLAEVDVEIRHRHALGIEEALEEEPEAHRVEIGDGQRIGDERARARAAAGSDGNVVRLRPFDEVGDDQEVALIAHADDDIDLEGEALAVGLDLDALRRAMSLEAQAEPLLGLALQLLGLDLCLRLLGLGLGGFAARHELREDGLLGRRAEGRAARDLDGRAPAPPADRRTASPSRTAS